MSATAMRNIITKATTKKQVMDAYASYPDTTPQGFSDFHASTVEPMLCEIPAGSKVLDVGCNSGDFLKLLEQAKQCEATGVDVSEPALALARAKGLAVVHADAEALPFADGSFDVVILREVLVHLHDPVKALKEIARVLKPSGFLLGSAPHANLERHWEDASLHHRYYTEELLLSQLSEAFESTHLKVLNGAQFTVGFAMSNMADVPAELLWKSGGKGLPEWEHALKTDTKTLRVWMGPTQPPGDAYYRMIGFAEKMGRTNGVEIGYEKFDWNSNDGCNEWQRKLLVNEEGNVVSALALDQLERCIKVADPLVFQVTYYDEVLGLFELIKQIYPKKKLITECDDWIFDIPAYNVASNPYRPNSPKEKIADEQLKLSDAIIVSTSFLKESLATMYPGKPIHVIPNALDFNVWDNVKSDGQMAPKKEGVIRIGYTGCGNHSGDLEIAKPVLLALLEEFPNLEIVIAAEFECFQDVKHPRLIVPGRWVNILDYPAMVKGWDLDIGIAPLRDNNFNRAKSNLRWLEYSALKIPTLASAVRPFAESIKDAVDGRLLSSKAAWYDALKFAIEHPDECRQMGLAAYNAVKDHFNMDKVAEQYRAVLEEIKNAH